MTFEEELRRYYLMGELSLDQCKRLWDIYERHGIDHDDKFYGICDKHELFKHIRDLNNEDWEVRRNAAWALGEIGDKRAIDPLLDRFQNDEHRLVRWNAAWALGEIGDPRAVDPLIKTLQNDEDILVRAYAARALEKLGVDPDDL